MPNINVDNVLITGGVTFLSEAPLPTGDPYWSNVSLLMNNTTTNNKNNNVFLDSGLNTFRVTRVGTVTQGSFSPFPVAANVAYSTSINGGSSSELNMSNYLQIGSGSPLNLSASDFTIEGWIYMNSLGGTQVIIGKNAGQYPTGYEYVLFIQNNALQFNCYTTGASLVSIASADNILSTTTWTHVAITRNGTDLSLYINGTRVNNITFSGTIATTSSSVTLGRDLETSGGSPINRPLNGLVSNVRIVKGTAVYTGSSYTVPTAPLTAISGTNLLLNFTNAGIYDSKTKNNLTTFADAKVSTAQAKFGTASVAFDGTGDFLSIPYNTALDLSSGDFTVEFWFNTSTVAAATQGLVTQFNGNALDRLGIQYLCYIATNNLYVVPYSGTTNYDIVFSNSISTNTWYHVALVRSGNSFYGFLNGQKNATVRTISGALNNNSTWLTYIGRYTEAGSNKDFNGYMQDLRITKGVARYTDNFTPPTDPFITY